MRTPQPLRSFRLPAVALAVLSALLLGACASEGTGSAQAAATVNGDEITIDEVRARVDAVRANPQFAEQMDDEEEGGDFTEQVQAEVLTGLVLSRLLAQGADDLGVEITDEDLEQQRERVVEQVGGEEAFEDLVEESNLTEDDVEAQLRDFALQEAVTDELVAEVDVDEDELREAYEQNYGTAQARHILVETEEAAQQVLGRLEAGEDFGELAREVSTDPSAEQNAGDLGEFRRGQMDADFSAAVFAADEGEIVGPVQTQFGFHVIEVVEVDEGPPLEEVEDEIRDQLLSGDREQQFDEWLSEQAAEAEITVNPRFGEWDGDARRVVPAEALEEPESDAEDGASSDEGEEGDEGEDSSGDGAPTGES